MKETQGASSTDNDSDKSGVAAWVTRQSLIWQVSPDLLGTVNSKGYFETSNPAWMTVLGWTQAEVASMSIFELLHPDDIERSRKQFVVTQQGEPAIKFVNRYRRKDGTYRWISWVGVPEGGLIFCSGRDITAEIEQAEQLAVARRERDTAWAVSQDLLVAVALDGTFSSVNTAWTTRLGWMEDELLGRRFSELNHSDDLQGALAVFANLPHAPLSTPFEGRMLHKDGSFRWFAWTAALAGESVYGNGREITAERENAAAQRVAQSLQEADRQKDEFLATLAHELRNPLAPIRTAVQLLAAPKASDQVRSRATEIIERQVGHMSRLLDDLLDVARITQRKLVLKREPVQIATVVAMAMEAAQSLADAKRHHLVAVLEDTTAVVLADPMRLAQVLTNLLNNAVKYTDPGGSIRLEARCEGDELCLTVTDNGIGLTPWALEHIFTMFAQEQTAIERSEGGLGIGLALAKGLVLLHGGSLSARSEGEGQGSCFIVKVPLVAGLEQQGTPAASDRLAQSLPALKVLLADDNQDSVEMLAELLRLSGHTVHTAYDGAQAADLAVQLQPDVLILDIGMPRMTGYEVAEHVLSQPWGASALLIAATGWGQDKDRQRALTAGFTVHLTKPFDLDQLVELLAERSRAKAKCSTTVSRNGRATFDALQGTALG